MKQLRARDRLIVALDYTKAEPALKMARSLKGLAGTLKIGSILFTACGPSIVRRVRSMGFSVMLDLKFFDIPSTVEGACRSAAGLGVSLLTVHASGERMMLQSAVRGVREEAKRLGVRPPRVLAVTVLTSAGSAESPRLARRVMQLAAAAADAGCDGIVASALEARSLRRRFGKRLTIVCPGIRPANARTQDQRRVMTPSLALKQGADFLVVGRPITEAANPKKAAESILTDMEEQESQC